jgi:hypothetical protein
VQNPYMVKHPFCSLWSLKTMVPSVEIKVYT